MQKLARKTFFLAALGDSVSSVHKEERSMGWHHEIHFVLAFWNHGSQSIKLLPNWRLTEPFFAIVSSSKYAVLIRLAL